MAWLLIAVVTAVLVAMGASAIFKLFSRRKGAKKAPFIKTYQTGTIKETTPEAESAKIEPEIVKPQKIKPGSTRTENRPAPIQGEEIQTEPQGAQLRNAATAVESPPASMLIGKKESQSRPVQAAARSFEPRTEPPQSAPAFAQAAAEEDEAAMETIQSGTEITEIESESIRPETASPQEKTPAPFITEIESEPIEAQTGTARTDTAPAEEKREGAPIETKTDSPAEAQSKITGNQNNPQTDIAETDITKVKTAAMESKPDAPEAESAEPPATDPTPVINQEEKVSEVLASGRLRDWVAFAETPLKPENFQAIIQKIAKTTYARRKEAKMRKIFLNHARKYIETFKVGTPADSTSEYIYKSLAIVLQEDRKFEEALVLCRKAIDQDMDDGTKTGYPGRIERLIKAQGSKK